MATKTLYVGNLPYSVSEGDLIHHFSKYEANNARIIEGRGFGFVDINADQLDTAIEETNMKDMSGRTLTVNEAKPKGSSSGGNSVSTSYAGGRSRESSGNRW
jgi:cold-inducible RNA-binding protein